MAKTWRCYNKSCGTPLGTIVNGELVLKNDDPNVQHICTDKAMLHVMCAKCGRVAKWVPKDSSLIDAVMNIHAIKAIFEHSSRMWNRAKTLVELEEAEADAGEIAPK